MIPTSRTSWLSKKETNSTITNTLQQAFSTKKCDETKRAETTTTTANKKTRSTPTAGETTTADTIGATGEETTTTTEVTMIKRINRLLNSKEIVGSVTNMDIKKSTAEPRNEETRIINVGTIKAMRITEITAMKKTKEHKAIFS